MSRSTITIALVLLALAVGASAQAPVDQSICSLKYPGAYHLSCYAANETVADVYSAKMQCFDAFLMANATFASNCTISVASNGTGMYGCGTYIVYVANSQACLDAYQAQEKTNPNCTDYKNAGLGDAANRNTANVTAPTNCTIPGPCAIAKPGPYHLSCYKDSLNTSGAGGVPGDLAETVQAAKIQCGMSFLANANATLNCSAAMYGGAYGTYQYGCDVFIGYTFGTQACLDAYQAQEKTNPNCTYYNGAGLAASPNRDTPDTYVNIAYTCGAMNSTNATSAMKRRHFFA